jgi:hypothetical protein
VVVARIATPAAKTNVRITPRMAAFFSQITYNATSHLARFKVAGIHFRNLFAGAVATASSPRHGRATVGTAGRRQCI